MKRERDFVCPRDFFPPGVSLSPRVSLSQGLSLSPRGIPGHKFPRKANTGEADRVGGLLFPDDHFVQKLLVGFRFEKFAHEPVHAFGGSLID